MNNFKTDYVMLAKKAHDKMMNNKQMGYYALANSNKNTRNAYMMLARSV